MAVESPDYAHRSRASSLSPNRVCCGFIVPPTLPLVKVASLRLQFSLSALVSHLLNLDGPSPSTSSHLRHDAVLYASHLSPRRPPQDGPWVVRIFSFAYVHILPAPSLQPNPFQPNYSLMTGGSTRYLFSHHTPIPIPCTSTPLPVPRSYVFRQRWIFSASLNHTAVQFPRRDDAFPSRHRRGCFHSSRLYLLTTIHRFHPPCPSRTPTSTTGSKTIRSHIYPYLRIYARTSKV
jgi:hypothetical protein